MSKVMEFKAKFIGDVSDITSNIKDLQQELNKLTLPDNLKGQFTKVINNLEKNTEKASKSLAAGFKTKGDVSSYEKTMNLIVSDMEKLSILMSRIDTSKLDFKVDGTQIKALVEYIAQLKAQINAISTRKLTEVQEIASKRSDTKKNAASWTEFFEAFKKGDEGIDDCEKALKRLQNQVNKAAEKVGGVEILTGKWAEYAKDVKVYEAALSDLKGNSKDLVSIKEELAKKEEELKNIQKEYTKAGVESVQDAIESTKQMTEGTKQYAKESGEAAENTQQLSNSLDSFKNKAAYFFGLSNAVNLFKRAVHSAFETVKELDDVMTETAVVTDFSVGDMWDQLPEYTQRANELGVSIHDAYKAATLYYQQGLKTNEVMAVSNETLKMARIAGLDAAEATSRMTNALRGFNMEINEDSAQRVNDVYSKLAAITASDTNEISTAMTKVASLAHNANMEFETTSAFLAQMIETTRESAETAGTALKTVIARFSEVKKLYSEGELMGTDEEGEEIDVNKVSTALRSAGINMNEYLTGAKGLDDIFIELASKWDSLDMIQQRYIATMAAGSRQQSRFIAMMSDYKRTTELVTAANTSAGASQKQFEKTLESLQSKLAQLSNSWKTFLMGIADNAIIKTVIDLLTDLLDTINRLFAGLDGLPGSIARVGAAFGMLMGGKALTKSLFKGLMGWDKEANKAGTEVGEGFIAGFKNRAKNSLKEGFKNFFSKEAWSFGLDTTVTKEIEIIQQQIQSSSAAMAGALAEGGDAMAMFDYYQNEYAQSTEALSILQNEELADIDKILVARALESGELSAETLAEEGLTEELKKELREKYKQEALSKRTVLSLIAETIAKGELLTANKASTLWLGLEAKAAKGNILAKYALAAADAFAAKSALGLMAATVAATAIIIGAAVAIYLVVKRIYEMINAEEIAKKSAEESAEAARKGAEEAAESYNKLSSSIDDLSEKYKNLEELTRGTTEWRDAVQEVNDKVLELMGTYEGLRVVSENGVLKVTNLEEVQQQAYTKKVRLQAAQLGASNVALQAENTLTEKRAREEYFSKRYEEEFQERQRRGEDTSDRSWVEAIEKEASELKIENENIKRNNELIESNNEALKSLELSNAELADGTVTESSAFLNSNRQDSFRISAWNEIADVSIDAIKLAVAKMNGYKSVKEYEKETGTTLSDASAREQVVQMIATKKATRAIELFSKRVENLSNLSPVAQKVYSREDFSGLSKQDIEKIGDPKASAKEFAENMWALMDEDEKALYSGFEGFLNDITQDYLTALENSKQATDQAYEKMVKYVTNPYEEDGVTNKLFSQLSGGVANDLADNFSKIFRISGAIGVKNIEEEINKLTEGMDSEQADKFVGIINSLNWENLDEAESLQDYVDELGFANKDVSDLTDKIIEFAKAARNVDLEKLTEEVQGMASLAANIRKGEQKSTGWSKENIQNAIAAGASMTDFVINVEDGSYTYVGEKLDDIYTLLVEKLDEKINVAEIRKRVQDANIIKDLARSGNLETRNGQENFLRGVYASTSGIISTDQINALQFMSDKEISDLVAKVQENTKGLEADEQALWDLEVTELALNNTNKELAQKADEGDDVALAALQGNARNSGVSDELFERYKDRPDALAILDDKYAEAQKLGIDADEFTDYIKQLKAAHKELTDVKAAQVALSSTKQNTALRKIVDSYEDWTSLLKEDGSLMTNLDDERAKVLAQFKKDVQDMLELDKDLSDGFWSPENIKLIQEAAEGSSDALMQLSINANRDYLVQIGVNVDKQETNDALTWIENYLINNAPDLEVGMSFDDDELYEHLNAWMDATGMTVEQMNQMFQNLGFGFEVEPVYADVVKSIRPNSSGGGFTYEYEMAKEPIGFRAKATKLRDTTGYTPAKKPSGGGGGSGSSEEEKPDYWENPFDELYNLQEKINESIRTREALERKYQKTVKLTESRLGEVTKAYADQIKQLRAEADLEKQMQEGRARQLNNIGNEIYTDSEGNRATFASLGVTKYASYDQTTGLLQIDWSGLEEIAKDPNRTKEGEAAEAYIKRLEELQSQFEEVRDKLWDIEDKIEELREEAIDNYLTFEDRVMEALVNSYQQEIDDFKELSDTIKSTTDDVIKNIQEDVALARQIRDNTKKEEDIAEMEARLAYLRRDTSGANDLEIKQLEEELNQARQDYSDDLIDQQIQQMQDEAEKAAEQREHQIDLMQHSLDMAIKNGDLWEEVYGLIDSSVNEDGSIKADSELMKLLKEGESFQSLSLIGQKKWMDEVAQAIKEALVGLGEAEDKWNIGDNDRRTGVSLDTFVERLYKEVLGRDADEAGKKYWVEQLQSGKLSRADVLKSFLGSEEFSKKNMGDEDFVETLYKTFFGRASDAEGKSYWTGQLKSGAKTRDDLINEFLKSTEWINSFMPKPGTGTKKPIGGGTSWADDTEKLPTMLDRKESENLVVLKDILGNLLNVSGGDAVKSNGDTYFDIHIDAEIGSDYDVDQLVERIKKQIYDTSAYRNANVINYIR